DAGFVYGIHIGRFARRRNADEDGSTRAVNGHKGRERHGHEIVARLTEHGSESFGETDDLEWATIHFYGLADRVDRGEEFVGDIRSYNADEPILRFFSRSKIAPLGDIRTIDIGHIGGGGLKPHFIKRLGAALYFARLIYLRARISNKPALSLSNRFQIFESYVFVPPTRFLIGAEA